MTTPCRDCQERERLCHSKCKRYQDYANQLDEQRKERQRDSLCTEYTAETRIKQKKQNFRKPKIKGVE